MDSARYRIVFDGALMPGMTAEAVKDNLARLFKTDRAKVDRLFDNTPVNIKQKLSAAEADKYLQAIRQAGAEARKEAEPQLMSQLSLVDIAPAGPAASAADSQQMDCPKCGHAQPTASQCTSCGIVIEKYLARQAELEGADRRQRSVEGALPYATPRAQVAEPMPEYGELRPFRLQGRIGRLRYLAWSLCLLFAALPAFAVAGLGFTLSPMLGALLIGLTGIAMLVVSVQLGVQRLHDMGWSGWFFLLNLVPVVGSFFPLVMLVIPGNNGANRFGPPQPPNSTAVKVLAALWLLVVIIAIVLAISIPSFRQYL